MAGGNTVTINGSNFPYAATSEYADQEHLVAHYDGIDNVGLGDRQHSTDTDVWVDLKSDNSLPRTDDGAGAWTNTGYKSDANYEGYAFGLDSVPSNFPIGNSSRTVEVIFRTPDNWALKTDGTQRGIFSYGENATAKSFTVTYRGLRQATNVSCNSGGEAFYTLSTTNLNAGTCAYTTNSLGQSNKISTVTSAYVSAINNANSLTYLNGTQITTQRGTGSLNTGTLFTLVLNRGLGLEALSIRLYNRTLYQDEIILNSELDKKRFTAPPTVSIGGGDCTNVVVLSTTQLQCTAPANAHEGKVDVTVTPTDGEAVNIENGYTYVDETAMIVTSISPTVGPNLGGPYVKIIGKNFGENAVNVDSVTIGEQTCIRTDVGVTNSTTAYYCILPAVSINESQFVDVVVTATDGTAYRLEKSFEYKAVSKDAVEARIE